MAPPRRNTQARTNVVSGYRGSEGRKRAEEEARKQKEKAEARKNQKHEPFRFYVPVGEERTFVILDEAPDFHRYEHSLKNPATDRYDLHVECINERDNCPACEAQGREGTYCLYLTVLDLTPFKTRKGEEVEFSRKLLVVKTAQQRKFYREYDRLVKDGYTMRGAIVIAARDGDKDPAIGNDLTFDGFMEEEELETYVNEYKDKEGKKHVENCFEVFDYDELFPPMTAEELRAVVGGKPTPGSREDNARTLGASRRTARRGSQDDDDDGDDGWEKPERSERMGKRGAPSKRRGQEDDDPDDDQDDADADDTDADDTPPPTRRGTRSAARKEPEAPPSRRASAAAKAQAPSRRSRSAEPDDSDDGDDDDPPFDVDDKPTKAAPAPRRGARRR